MTSASEPFVEFPKIARLARECVVTEKIDGTNACIFIGEDGEFLTGSRTRWITPQDDNHGFSMWAHEHKEELRQLGNGRHFGEWWGGGINRGYGLKNGEKRFSLFDAIRWCEYGTVPRRVPSADPRIEKWQDVAPACCHVVPELFRGEFQTGAINIALEFLSINGSQASPGFMKPEGVVVFHIAGNVGFKRTLEKDAEWKGKP